MTVNNDFRVRSPLFARLHNAILFARLRDLRVQIYLTLTRSNVDITFQMFEQIDHVFETYNFLFGFNLGKECLSFYSQG